MYYNLRHAYPNELIHSGIKGQKWGRRRYQNYDGTLTSAGKVRYASKEYREELEYNTTGRSPNKTTSINTSSDIGRYNPKASKEWNEAMGYLPSSTQTSPDVGKYNPNASAEYNAELAYNSQKNSFNQTPTQWRKANADKVKDAESFVDKVKNVATKVSNIAKKAIDKAKSIVSKLFAKKSPEVRNTTSVNVGSGAYTFTLENGKTAYKGRR